MEKALLQHLETLLPDGIHSVRPIAGGDIAQVYALETPSGTLLAKTHQGKQGYAMLQAEKRGLDAISTTHTIRVPEVRYSGQADHQAFLILEFIETKRPVEKDMALLGEQLAQLHQVPCPYFGFEEDNFIGSLPQSNCQHADWGDFYIQERLLPQLYLASVRGLLDNRQIPDPEQMREVCTSLFDSIRPSLLHGDLWSGNYFVATDGTPFVIDPAVYFGHCEVDLAMSRLFGGFSTAFYEAYYHHHPPKPGASEREDLYQLYYLLVHLNLFGNSYYSAVERIMNRYF